MTEMIRKKWRNMTGGTRVMFLIGILGAGVAFIAYAVDSDFDGMSDSYESLFTLNVTNAADAAEEYDGDTLVNLSEFQKSTDPWESDTDRDGWRDDFDNVPVSRLYIDWGEFLYTFGDDFQYTGPAWWIDAYRIDGNWETNHPTAWNVPGTTSNDVGYLVVNVDRTLLTNDLVLAVTLFDQTNATAYVDLYDTNGVAVATNITGDIIGGSGIPADVLIDVPLEDHPDAVTIGIRRGTGDVTIYQSLLYIDKDHDGLDSDQEDQLNTSDNAADSDSDSLTDYAEVFTYGTDPADADTDDDVLPDGEELNQSGTDPLDADTDDDGTLDGAETDAGTDPLDQSDNPFTEFLHRMEIDLSSYDRAEALVDFPVLVKLSDDIPGFSYDSFAFSDGRDLLFADGVYGSEINYEIETWNTSGDSYVWVQVPELTGAGTHIYAYWGNADATNAPAYTTNGATWNAGYAAVWHLNATNANAELPDSSPHGVDVGKGGTTEAVGVIAGSRNFGGDYIPAAISNSWDRFSFSCWANTDYLGNNQKHMLSREDGSGTGRSLMYQKNKKYMSYLGGSQKSSDFTLSIGAWNHYALTYDTGVFRLYVNGELRGGPFNRTEEDATGDFIIGAHKNLGGKWDGKLDEMRISSTARSENWFWASWLNQSDPTAFAQCTAPVETVCEVESTYPENVTADTATLTGELQASSVSPCHVSVFWGTSDAGATESGWDYVTHLGECSSGSLAANVSGLSEQTVYYYRFVAGNAAGVAWSPAAATFTTVKDMSGWTRKTAISFDGYDASRTEALTDFPALVILNESITGFSYADFASPEGGDLRFLDISRQAELSYEIESWNTNGNSYVWVRVPELRGEGARVYAYWGNPAATTAPVYTTNGATWDAAYEAVYHLNSTNASGKMSDSSANQADLSVFGTPLIGAEGLSAGAVEFSGAAGNKLRYDVNPDTTYDAFTVMLFARTDDLSQPQWSGLFNNDSSNDFQIDCNGSGSYRYKGGAGRTFGAITTNWMSLAVSCDADTPLTTLYLDGTQVNTWSGQDKKFGQFEVGVNRSENEPFTGVIDEVRISSVERSPDWLWAASANMADSSGFAALSAVEDMTGSSSGSDMDSLPDAWELAHFGNLDAFDSGDADRDGLTNLGEYQNGTDPLDPDSDDDGLSDGDEANVHGTDPTTSDTDADTFNDGYELRNGGDPLDASVIAAFVEAGTVTTDETWTEVTLNNAFDDPTVIALTPSYEGEDPTTVRIKDVTPGSFKIRMHEWEYLDGTHSDEAVSYVAVERGRFRLVNGTWVEAGSKNIACTGEFVTVTFDQAFATTPAVFSSVATDNDSAPACTRLDAVTASGFDLLVEEEEASDQIHAEETIGWVAWEPSAGALHSDLQYEVRADASAVNEKWKTVMFKRAVEPLHVIAHIQTYEGSDTAVLRQRERSEVGVRIRVEEEKSADNEDDHADEQVALMVISPLDSDGDGLTDADEAAVGSDADDPDSDDDGLNDYEEVEIWLTNPLNADTDGDETNDLSTVVDLDGTNTYRRAGQWGEAGSLLYSLDDVNARVEYEITVPEGDMYRLGLDLTNANTNAQEALVFTFQLLIDGTRVQWCDAIIESGTNAVSHIRTPWLSTGTHTIRLAWLDDYNADKQLGINRVTLEKVDGLDSDSNGRQDAVNAVLSEENDADGDGLSDVDELDIHGTDVLGVDSDGDSLSDYEELNTFGTSPVLLDSDTDGVGDAAELFTCNAEDTVFQESWHMHATWQEDGNGGIHARRMYSKAYYDVVVTNAGMHRVGLQLSHYPMGQNSYITDPPDDFEFKIRLDINGHTVGDIEIFGDVGLSGTGYLLTPWLSEGEHRIGFEWIGAPNKGREVAGRDPNLLLEAVSVHQLDGLDSNTNGVQDWVEAELATAGDTDGDGLSDYDEVFVHGTDPVNIDTDGDGLDDKFEIDAGLDPNDADTDSDGITDWQELTETLTDPLVAEFDGTYEELATLSGSEGEHYNGTWSLRSRNAYCLDRVGYADYVIQVPTNGHHALSVDLVARIAMDAAPDTELEVSLDGQEVGRQSVSGFSAPMLFFLPYLSQGEHTVRLRWYGVPSDAPIGIAELRLLHYGGYDEDQNGIPDWIDVRQDLANNSEIVTNCLVSPLCIEGSGWGAGFITVTSSYTTAENTNGVVEVCSGLVEHWYANVPLSPTSETQIAIAANNGSLHESHAVLWDAFNIAGDVATNGLQIRSGDSLLLMAAPAGATNGTVSIDIYRDTIWTTNLQTTVAAPIPWAFDQAGSYELVGTYTNGAEGLCATAAVAVAYAAFPADPICLAQETRTWSCPAIPDESVIEFDSRMTLSAASNGSGGSTLTVTAPQPGEFPVLARLGDTGPIMDVARVQGLVYDTTADLTVDIIEIFSDWSQLVELRLWFSSVPENLRIELDIFAGGVVFEDGSTLLEITADDIGPNGEFRCRFIRGANVTGSVCHNTRIYDGDKKIN